MLDWYLLNDFIMSCSILVVNPLPLLNIDFYITRLLYYKTFILQDFYITRLLYYKTFILQDFWGVSCIALHSLAVEGDESSPVSTLQGNAVCCYHLTASIARKRSSLRCDVIGGCKRS